MNHLEILVEEPSMEAFLRELLPNIPGGEISFNIYPFQGKNDLLDKLPQRLQGYADWLPKEWRILVLVDRDDDDCHALKQRLEQMAATSGLVSRTAAPNSSWQVANRIAIEELESWYFGDWEAVRRAYPKVSPETPGKAAYRNPDAIAGGTWETFERILQRAGYFKGGLRKIEVARTMGQFLAMGLEPDRNRSHSFRVFHHLVRESMTDNFPKG